MAKFYAAATVVVLTIAVLVTAWVRPDLLPLHLRPTELSAPPKPQDSLAPPGPNSGAMTISADWVLSVLPECLSAESVARGPLAFVRSKLPSGAHAFSNGESALFGDCTILQHGDEVVVRRGHDRFDVPPSATLYHLAHGLAVMRVSGATAILRTYSPSTLQP